MADINIGQFSEAFNNKADTDMSNVTQEGWDIVQEKIDASGGDVITATNNTGSAITEGVKVWLNGSSAVSLYSTQTVLDMTKSQTPTLDSDYIASGFTKNNQGFIGPFIVPFDTADSWELCFKINLISLGSSNKVFFCSCTSTSGMLPLLQKAGVILFTQSGVPTLRGVYSSSSSAYDFQCACQNSMTEVTWEWVKAGFTGSKYYIAQSSDGETWTQGEEFTSSTKCALPASEFSLGASFNSSGYYFNYGAIDLKEVYMIINGVKTWIPVVRRTNVDENTITGIAKENIASGSAGQVETILPE